MQYWPAKTNPPAARSLSGVLQVLAALVDQDAAVAAQLQGHPLLACARLQVPADAGAAGERQHRDPVVPDQELGDVVAARQDRQRLRRKPGLDKHLTEQRR